MFTFVLCAGDLTSHRIRNTHRSDGCKSIGCASQMSFSSATARCKGAARRVLCNLTVCGLGPAAGAKLAGGGVLELLVAARHLKHKVLLVEGLEARSAAGVERLRRCQRRRWRLGFCRCLLRPAAADTTLSNCCISQSHAKHGSLKLIQHLRLNSPQRCRSDCEQRRPPAELCASCGCVVACRKSSSAR